MVHVYLPEPSPTKLLQHGWKGRAARLFPSRVAAGFTLMEIMVVIFIISLLASIVGVGLFDHWEKAKRTKAAADISSMKAALRLYKLDHGRYPTSAEGLQALAEISEGGEESYLERVQNDPWGNAYVYSSDGRQFLLRSLARDGQDGGDGFDADISSDAV